MKSYSANGGPQIECRQFLKEITCKRVKAYFTPG